MLPHFNGNIELGQVLIVIAIFIGVVRILSALEGLEMEHEMLIDDYCERKGIKRKDLITRRRRNFFSILLSGGRPGGD